MAMVPISVVIPAFNSGDWIEQAIDSVLNQSARPEQILVVDDGSTDDTAAKVRRYGERVSYIHQANGGVAAARNRGLGEARGKLIAFLDADDVWHPQKLELQFRALHAHPNVGLLGTSVFDWPAESPVQIDSLEPAPVVLVPRERLAVRNYFTTSSVLARAELVRHVGDFDVALRGPEDYDYWLRAVEVTQVANLALPLTGYRCVPTSLSKRATSMEAGLRRILRKLDGRDFWRGDRLLRRRAYSYADYSCAHLHGAAGAQAMAVKRILSSLAWYPLPYRRAEAGAAFGRPKRMAVLLLRMLGLMSPDPNCQG